jgi:hypothetical protein
MPAWNKITNAPLFKKLKDIIFYLGQSLYEPFLGTFWDFLPNCDILRSFLLDIRLSFNQLIMFNFKKLRDIIESP